HRGECTSVSPRRIRGAVPRRQRSTWWARSTRATRARRATLSTMKGRPPPKRMSWRRNQAQTRAKPARARRTSDAWRTRAGWIGSAATNPPRSTPRGDEADDEHPGEQTEGLRLAEPRAERGEVEAERDRAEHEPQIGAEEDGVQPMPVAQHLDRAEHGERRGHHEARCGRLQIDVPFHDEREGEGEDRDELDGFGPRRGARGRHGGSREG